MEKSVELMICQSTLTFMPVFLLGPPRRQLRTHSYGDIRRPFINIAESASSASQGVNNVITESGRTPLWRHRGCTVSDGWRQKPCLTKSLACQGTRFDIGKSPIITVPGCSFFTDTRKIIKLFIYFIRYVEIPWTYSFRATAAALT